MKITYLGPLIVNEEGHYDCPLKLLIPPKRSWGRVKLTDRVKISKALERKPFLSMKDLPIELDASEPTDIGVLITSTDIGAPIGIWLDSELWLFRRKLFKVTEDPAEFVTTDEIILRIKHMAFR